jgi:hypothetical protein
MNPEPAEWTDAPKGRKPLWRRVLKWTLRVAVALVVLLAVAWGILNYVSARALEGEIAKLRAAGQPVTFAEWEKSLPKVAEADDAAPFYRAALAMRRRSTDGRVNELMDWVRAASSQPARARDPSAAEVKQVLAANALALEMVDRGSSRPQCAYDFGLSYGIGAVLPQMASARSLAKLLYLRTVWLARQGKGGEAADSLVSSLRMLRMFDRQPMLIGHLVKVACVALDVDAVAAVLEAGRLSDRQLATLESALAEADPTRGLDQVWVAEQVYKLELFRTLIRPPKGLIPQEGSPLPEAAPPGLLASPVFRLMVVDALRTCARCAEAARLDWPQALEAMQAVARSRHGVFGLFSEILGPSYENAFVLFARTVGCVRSAQVAVMVERYCLAKRRLPASLQELRDFIGHDLPADPFTGKDLIYKVQRDAFSVYSVGEDKVDDGGLFQGRDRRDWGVSVRRAR